MRSFSSFNFESFLTASSLAWGILILLIIVVFYWYGFGRFKYFKTLGISGPKPYPFIGNLPDLAKHNFQLHLLFDECVKKYGKIFGIHLMGNPALVISDVDMLREILVREFPKFHDRKFFRGIPKPYDMMMSVAIGERWRYIRNTLNPTFSAPRVRQMIGLVDNAVGDIFMQIQQSDVDNEMIDICKLFQSYSMRSILAASFGVQASDNGISYTRISEYARNALNEPLWINLVFMLPLGDTILKYIPWAFSTRYEPIARLAKEIIDRRRRNENNEKDLLQMMLDAQKIPDSQGRTMTDDEILAQCIIYLIAGYETTSTVLILTVYLLSMNPDKQRELQKEIDELSNESDEDSLYSDVMSLPYMDMVLSEVLRLYPPAYNLLRYCNQECRINGIRIPAGVHIFVPTYTLQRDKCHWENPEQFNPERFRPENQTHNKYAFCPFGHGPRNCIGQRFAFLEMKLALMRIFKRFSAEKCTGTPLKPNITARTTLTIMDPIFVRFVERCI